MGRANRRDSSAALRTPAPTILSRAFSAPDVRIGPIRCLFPAVPVEIEGEDALVIRGALEDFAMTQGAPRVVISGAPVLLHARTRKLVVLRVPFVILRAIDQLDDVVDLPLGLFAEQPRFGAVLQLLRHVFHQVRKRVAKALDIFELIGAGARAARIAVLLFPGDVAWEIALCIPEVDLEGEGIAARLGIDHPLQRRIGNEAAVPILLAFDLDCRKTGRQRAAGHDVLRPDGVSGVVEIDEVAGSDVDRARAEARHPGVESIEIHQTLQCLLEGIGVVKAGCFARPTRLHPGGHRTRREESRCTTRESEIGAHLVEEIAAVVAERRPTPWRVRSRLRPKLAQPVYASTGRVAGDDGRVNRSDRYAGDPVRMDVCLRQGLVHAALVGPQCTAALQNQGDAFERQASFRRRKVRSNLKIHGAPSSSSSLTKLYGIVHIADDRFCQSRSLHIFVLVRLVRSPQEARGGPTPISTLYSVPAGWRGEIAQSRFSDFRKLGGSSSWGTRRRVSRSWKAAAAIPRRADWREISMRRRFPSSLRPIPFTGRQEKIDAFANEGRQLLFQGFRLMPQ